MTAVPVYPFMAHCSLCLPSFPKLILPLLELRFASQVASYSLYCTICTARLMNYPGEVLCYENNVNCCVVNNTLSERVKRPCRFYNIIFPIHCEMYESIIILVAYFASKCIYIIMYYLKQYRIFVN